MCTKVEAGSSQPSLPNYPTRKRLRGRDARDSLNSTNVNAFVPNQKCQQYCVAAKCCDAAVIENPSFSGLVLSPLGVYTNAISGEHVITNCQSSNAKNTMVCSKYRQLCSNDKDTVEATPNELFPSKDTDAEAVEEVESISMPAASILSDSPVSSPSDSPSAIPAATILTGSPTRPSDSTSVSGNQTINTVLVGNQSMEALNSPASSPSDSPPVIPAATIPTGSPSRPSDSTSVSGNQTINTVLAGNQSMEAGDSPASSPSESPPAIPAATVPTCSPTCPSDSTSVSPDQTIDSGLVGNQSMEAGGSYLTSYVDVQNIQDSCASDWSTFLIQTGDESARAKCIQACFDGLCCFANGLGVKNLTKSCYIGNEHQCSQYAPCLILRETHYTDVNNLTTSDAVSGTIAVVNNTELGVDLTASTVSNSTGTPNETAANILNSRLTANEIETLNVQELESVLNGTSLYNETSNSSSSLNVTSTFTAGSKFLPNNTQNINETDTV
eukprot:scaffold248428_cov54-Cyclotella_meneghiniana.AAC.2